MTSANLKEGLAMFGNTDREVSLFSNQVSDQFVIGSRPTGERDDIRVIVADSLEQLEGAIGMSVERWREMTSAEKTKHNDHEDEQHDQRGAEQSQFTHDTPSHSQQPRHQR